MPKAANEATRAPICAQSAPAPIAHIDASRVTHALISVEEELRAIKDCAQGIFGLAGDVEGHDKALGMAIWRLATNIIDCAKAVADTHSAIFSLTKGDADAVTELTPWCETADRCHADTRA